jgi:hypothetical protein
MAEINKIIFTTKEAYAQKVAEGTLEESTIYAIDAAQAVDKKEVQTTVDNSFTEFGFNLGISREAAKFYSKSVSLVDMLKGIIIEKLTDDLSNTYPYFGNKTNRILVTGAVIPSDNVFVKVIQDETDHGYCHYEYNKRPNDSLATVIIPDGVNLEADFELKVSNLFGTAEQTFPIKHSFESTAIEKLQEFVSEVNFEQAATKQEFGAAGNYIFDNGLFKLVPNREALGDNFYNTLNGFGTKYCVLKSKDGVKNIVESSLISSDDSKVLFLTPDFNEYVDLGTGEWVAFPESEKENIKKLSDRYTAKINE